MNDFDFMRNLPFGQYLSLDTPLERIDCRARIISFVMILAVLTITRNLGGLIFGLVVIILSLLIMRFPLAFCPAWPAFPAPLPADPGSPAGILQSPS